MAGPPSLVCGCVLEAIDGCHLAGDGHGTDWPVSQRKRMRHEVKAEDGQHPVIVEVVPSGVAGQQIGSLAVTNNTAKSMVVYLSAVCDKDEGSKLLQFYDRQGNLLKLGTSLINNEEQEEVGEEEVEDLSRGAGPAPVPTQMSKYRSVDCITFVLVLDPYMVMTPASVNVVPFYTREASMSKLAFELEPHPAPDGVDPVVFPCFPLQPSEVDPGPFLCTQSRGGRLTHFFKESYHAIDLRCNVGTYLLAVADGVVTEVKDKTIVHGIYCLNLLDWNCVTIKTTTNLIVEYIHIAENSAVVSVGQKVKAGDPICKSGVIGFAPEPHIHIEVHTADQPRGPSLPILFRATDGHVFGIEVGKSYLPTGDASCMETKRPQSQR